MPKTKTKDITRFQNKGKCNLNYNIPKEISGVLSRLEKLDFVQHIRFGAFRNTKNEKGIRIVGYDEKTRNYIVNVKVDKYEQRLFIQVDEQKEDYKNLIVGCF